MTMRLLYIANVRLPTEKAHGLQIMQNCEAFAENGAQVTLWAARRVNTPELRGVDAFAHYGVNRAFQLKRLPTLDLVMLASGQTGIFARLFFALQTITFIISAFIGVLFHRAEIIYSRDALVLLLLLSLLRLKRAVVGYEAHTLAKGRFGRWAQKQVVRRVNTFATTRKLADELVTLGANPARTFVAHDGIRAARFQNLPAQDTARREIGWPENAFIVGYVGRLQTLAMDKGVGTVIEALAQIPDAYLALVGGPDEIAESYRRQWLELGLPESHFLYAGQVKADRVPVYLRAFDIGTLPLPFTEHFAYYASPIKLFEYMAAGCVVAASDLPSIREVITNGENGLLTPPSATDALAEAIRRLEADPSLRANLAHNARQLVFEQYTWSARAAAILSALAAPIERSVN